MIAFVTAMVDWFHQLAIHNPFAAYTLTGFFVIGLFALFSSDRGPMC